MGLLFVSNIILGLWLSEHVQDLKLYTMAQLTYLHITLFLFVI